MEGGDEVDHLVISGNIMVLLRGAQLDSMIITKSFVSYHMW